MLVSQHSALAGGGGTKQRGAFIRVKNISTGPVGAAVPTPLVTMETVEVGDAANAPLNVNGTDLGAVSQAYRIGTREVTIEQYAVFLNAVAVRKDGANGTIVDTLYDPRMASDRNVAGISRAGQGTAAVPYVYTTIGDASKPIAYVSWFNAARFANWMHHGATASSDTETGAYTLNLATAGTIARNPDARWWIPSQDEWFKAAYYKGGGTAAGYWRYPTKSDSFPSNNNSSGANQANFLRSGLFCITQSSTLSSSENYLTAAGTFTGSPGPYGTFDQGGNVDEWTEAVVSTSFGEARVTRGGAWNSGGLNNDAWPVSTALPSDRLAKLGFRLAGAPVVPSGSTALTGSFDIVAGANQPLRVAPGEVVQFSVRPGAFTVTAADAANPTLVQSGTLQTSGNRVDRITVGNAGGVISLQPAAADATF